MTYLMTSRMCDQLLISDAGCLSLSNCVVLERDSQIWSLFTGVRVLWR